MKSSLGKKQFHKILSRVIQRSRYIHSKKLDTRHAICKILEKDPKEYISFVQDRLGHDFRYAINNDKIVKELNWKPKTNLMKGLKKTIEYYKRK